MKLPNIGFFIGLTLVLVSFGYCYEAYNYEFTINTIFVGIILFIPLGLIGLALIKSGAAKTDNSSLFLFGSIWVGVMCFGFAALMIWEASQFPPGGRYQPLITRHSLPATLLLGTALTGIPLLIVFGLLKRTEPPTDFEPPRSGMPKSAAADNDPLGIRNKLGK